MLIQFSDWLTTELNVRIDYEYRPISHHGVSTESFLVQENHLHDAKQIGVHNRFLYLTLS